MEWIAKMDAKVMRHPLVSVVHRTLVIVLTGLQIVFTLHWTTELNVYFLVPRVMWVRQLALHFLDHEGISMDVLSSGNMEVFQRCYDCWLDGHCLRKYHLAFISIICCWLVLHEHFLGAGKYLHHCPSSTLTLKCNTSIFQYDHACGVFECFCMCLRLLSWRLYNARR